MNILQNLRKANKKNQSEVAAFLGISYQAYAHYEKGRRQPDPETLSKLADFYNVSIDYILGRESNIKKAPTDTASAYSNKIIDSLVNAGLEDKINQLNEKQLQSLFRVIDSFIDGIKNNKS